MTAVFKVSRSGSLQNFQVGVVDVVATAAAATSAWGWVGGLRGLQNMLRITAFNVEGHSKVFQPPSKLPTACKMLTFRGIATFQDEQAEAFGGDSALQLAGFTLCALSHELRSQFAIDLFMTYLAPKRFRQLFEGLEGAREVLHTELVENCSIILNEGASRGLPEIFDRAATDIHLNNNLHLNDPTTNHGRDEKFELHLVGGLLSWISSECPEPYFTRSALVLRISAYLKAVGYQFGDIDTWSGHGTPPTRFRSVFLVLGGSSPTDRYADHEDEFSSYKTMLKIHYRYNTVGSMFFSTMRRAPRVSPEALQDYFDSIEKGVADSMTSTWKMGRVVDDATGESSLQVLAQANIARGQHTSSSTALRLSSFYFARCAESVAKFYQRIAQPATLEVVKKHLDADDFSGEIDARLIEFRMVTISILLAIIGHFGGPDYINLRHATLLSLQHPTPIKDLASMVEKLLVDGLTFSRLAGVLAYIHGAQVGLLTDNALNYDDLIYSGLGVVGFRRSSYAVLPALLCNMAEGPSQSALGFQCFDTFIANVPVQKDGSIKSSSHCTMSKSFRDEQLIKDLMALENPDKHNRVDQMEAAKPQVRLAQPVLQPPDVPLYLNIERPLDQEGPVLGLCGRIHGSAIGNVGVFPILRTIIRSLRAHDKGNSPQRCPRRRFTSESDFTAAQASSPMPLKCLIVPPSIWSNESRKPTGDPYVNVYIPVEHDNAWALFLAGQADARICLCCADCTVADDTSLDIPRDDGKFLIIGY